MLQHLERMPSGLHGQCWRSLISLLVQDGGVVGLLFNVVFLVTLGVLAEQVVGCGRWLASYLVVGLVGEAAGRTDIHGAALLAGLALAGVFALPAGPDPRSGRRHDHGEREGIDGPRTVAGV